MPICKVLIALLKYTARKLKNRDFNEFQLQTKVISTSPPPPFWVCIWSAVSSFGFHRMKGVDIPMPVQWRAAQMVRGLEHMTEEGRLGSLFNLEKAEGISHLMGRCRYNKAVL